MAMPTTTLARTRNWLVGVGAEVGRAEEKLRGEATMACDEVGGSGVVRGTDGERPAVAVTGAVGGDDESIVKVSRRVDEDTFVFI